MKITNKEFEGLAVELLSKQSELNAVDLIRGVLKQHRQINFGQEQYNSSLGARVATWPLCIWGYVNAEINYLREILKDPPRNSRILPDDPSNITLLEIRGYISHITQPDRKTGHDRHYYFVTARGLAQLTSLKQ
jgi:hypothetical protein